MSCAVRLTSWVYGYGKANQESGSWPASTILAAVVLIDAVHTSPSLGNFVFANGSPVSLTLSDKGASGATI